MTIKMEISHAFNGSKTVKAINIGLMVILTKENGKMDKNTEREFTKLTMEKPNILAILNTTKNAVRV